MLSVSYSWILCERFIKFPLEALITSLCTEEENHYVPFLYTVGTYLQYLFDDDATVGFRKKIRGCIEIKATSY